MTSMRWKFWSGRRDRLALALLGVLVLGAGLSVLAILGEDVNGTVIRTYEQSWRTPYDILVHAPLPGGQPLPDLVEPNVLATLPPGISMRDLDAIRGIQGVDVAAPLAVIGVVKFPLPELGAGDLGGEQGHALVKTWPVLPPGVYRFHFVTSYGGGPWPEQMEQSDYFAVPDNKGNVPSWARQDLWKVGPNYGGLASVGQWYTTLVAVDPAAEAKLVGLDRAVVDGRYFSPGDHDFAHTYWRNSDALLHEIPILVNSTVLNDLSYTAELQRLKSGWVPEGTVFRQTFGAADLMETVRRAQEIATVIGRPGLLTYTQTRSPFSGRWPTALQLRSQPDRFKEMLAGRRETPTGPYGFGTLVSETEVGLGGSYRTFTPFPMPTEPGWKDVKFIYVGSYDTTRLPAQRGGQQLPLMTYRPFEATRVLDPRGAAVNPPVTYRGDATPAGFLTAPPGMITTLDAAVKIDGPKAINAVRVKITDDDHLTPETIGRAKAIAKEIEEKTGLVAEVTMGSSPANVLVDVPASNGHPALGWVEERWVHLNAPVTAVDQAEFGYSAFIGLALLVTVIYTVATGLAGVTARRRELGVAAAGGGGGLKNTAPPT
ncbi:MAG: hypothetical protein IRZ18_04200, partial [Clostridia bacterium]|nr:hypothetical protein [Clostridia bacterium]